MSVFRLFCVPLSSHCGAFYFMPLSQGLGASVLLKLSLIRIALIMASGPIGSIMSSWSLMLIHRFRGQSLSNATEFSLDVSSLDIRPNHSASEWPFHPIIETSDTHLKATVIKGNYTPISCVVNTSNGARWGVSI